MKNILKQFVLVPTLGLQLVTPQLPLLAVSEPVEPDNSQIINYQLSIKLDTNSPIPVTSTVYTPAITLGKSRYQEEEEKQEALRRAALAQGKRQVIPRDVIRTSDPGFEAKRALVKKIAAEKGIDWKILEAVWQVESGKRWDTNVRSYAGATGPAQFMPGTFRKYGEDYDGDGVASIYDAHDSVAAAANLLVANGLKDGDQYRALLAYNRADWYVKKVQKVADSIVE